MGKKKKTRCGEEKIMRKAFLTVGFSGLSPIAPGTVGSFVSLILAILLLQVLPSSSIFLLSILITVIAVKQINIYEEQVGAHDGKEIVIDELAGMWLAFTISGATQNNWLILAILSFVFFRLFDIWKPSIIGTIDAKAKGGWGVMGDDIVAGIIAGLCASATNVLIVNYL
jgi:phosphatidylglycerophosphatase A